MKKFVSRLLLVTLIILLIVPFASCSFSLPIKITIPYSSAEYENGDWNVESLVKHFEDLGFSNIETISWPSDFGDYTDEIISVEIERDSDSFFTEYSSFKKDYSVYSFYKIRITYYYTPDALTIDNCPDLKEVLFGSEDGELMDYMIFARKYDGQYVRFDACISYSAWGEVVHVVGGDDISSNGYAFHIQTPYFTYNPNNKGKEEGQLVRVYGKIDAGYSEYFEMITICQDAFEPR